MKNLQNIIIIAHNLERQTQGAKHKFNLDWIDNLTNYYKENQGKAIIHLSDIKNNLFLKLNSAGRKILSELISRKGYSDSIRSIKNFLRTKKNFISLRNLKIFLGRKIDILESYILEIKTTKSGSGKPVKNPKFPIDLTMQFGAVLLGNYPDAAIKTGYFGSKDKELLYELSRYFNEHVGKIKPTIWKKNKCYGMQISSLIKIIYRLSGLDTSNQQVITNNALPYWIFHQSENFQKLLLRKLWDAEGSAPVNKKMCLGQSVVVNDVFEDIPHYPKRKSFSNCKGKHKIINNPPNFLVSLQLLLFKFGIISYIKPHGLYKRKNGMIVCDWHLIITRYPNIKKFYDEIGFGLKRKQEKLKQCLDSYTRNYPEDKSLRENEITELIKNLERFTILDILEKMKLSEGTIRNYLTYLCKNKKIIKVRTISQIGKRSFLNEYAITKKSEI